MLQQFKGAKQQERNITDSDLCLLLNWIQLLAAGDSVDSLLLGLAVTDNSALTDELHAMVHMAELLNCIFHLSPTHATTSIDLVSQEIWTLKNFDALAIFPRKLGHYAAMQRQYFL